MDIRVQEAPFELGRVVEEFTDRQVNMGAIVTFTGITRDLPGAGMDRMEMEHYPGMTERALAKIAQDALDRWDLGDVLIIHRYGVLKPQDRIMMVATASRHRAHAFEAAEFLMDYLKSRAPFWKKEITKDGAEWVDSKDEDEAALNRW
ncbi:molybdenum cofactor biosynthesis protein MoaE [Thalassobius sp. MITS945101]|uniref:molybdenum cofactor biosynthesis protein MoaE n=1 Tax=Thalassobius sp. MITS945101 TaxID=3096994 RepID=UPI00399B842C